MLLRRANYLIILYCLFYSHIVFAQTVARITSVAYSPGNPLSYMTLSVQENGSPVYQFNPDSMTLIDNNLRVLNYSLLKGSSPLTHVPTSTALVLDKSFSMEMDWPVCRLDGMKSGVKKFIDKLDVPSDEAELISFSSTYNVDIFMTNDFALLKQGVDAIQAYGSTALYDATAVGIQEVTNNGISDVKSVIVVTDGFDNRSPMKLDEVTRLAQCSKVRVFTIGIGSFVKDSVLQVMANETGGQYFKCRFGTDVVNVMSQIADLMHRRYDENTFWFISPDYMDKEHSLTARLSVNQTCITSTKKLEVCTTPVSSIQTPATKPVSLSLEQNSPNPFSSATGSTLIRFEIFGSKQDYNVTLSVYDVFGREVKSLLKTKLQNGSYSIPFNGAHLPSGIYFYELSIENQILSKKMILTK